MNNSKTPKIVIGVGLAALYAAGLGYFTLRGDDDVIAQSAPTAQTAPAAVAPTEVVATASDASTSVAESPVAAPAATETVASAVAKTVNPAPISSESDARFQSKQQALASLAAAPAPEKTNVEKSTPASEVASVVSEQPAATVAPEAVPANAPSGNDSQITADVKSQIVAVAPAANIDVTTRDGVVELTGSVPSEEVIDKARLAARNVAAVRDVDVSALTVSN